MGNFEAQLAADERNHALPPKQTKEPTSAVEPPEEAPPFPITAEEWERIQDGTQPTTFGYVGEKDVQIDDTGPYAWDNQVVDRGQFEDGLRQDERNAALFSTDTSKSTDSLSPRSNRAIQPTALNYRITDDSLGVGGPKATPDEQSPPPRPPKSRGRELKR